MREGLTPKGNNFILPNGGADSPQGNGLYGSPPGRSFCAYKRNQNTLGAVPQDPLTLKLRLDTDWAFQLPLKSRSVQRRRYALKVPAAHFNLDSAETKLK